MNNILVVDDEKVIRANFCEILRMEGFSAIEASSGDEAQGPSFFIVVTLIRVLCFFSVASAFWV